MNAEISEEIERLKEEFSNADETKLRILEPMIEQAAHERAFLRRLNEQAVATGLVKVHPDNSQLQKSLPVSGEIARHSATLTNIMDKLMKHLGTNGEDDDDDLGEYE